MGGGGGGGRGEKEGTGVKWASHYYIYFINQYYAGGLSSFISLLTSFVSYFQMCNSLFSNCKLDVSFSALQNFNIHCKLICLPTKLLNRPSC